MEKKEKKERDLKYLCRLFWIFIIGSLVGFAYENILVLFQKGHFVLRQGLLYGPLIPVYGIGAVIYEIIIPKMESPLKSFFYSMFLGAVVEYICSYVQEVLFGTISWDYHWVKINFNGRTSILHAFYWGLAGVIFYDIVHPWFNRIMTRPFTKRTILVTGVTLTFILIDVFLSWSACYRQKERVLNIEPRSEFDVFLDEHYPDEKIDKIYTNKILKI